MGSPLLLSLRSGTALVEESVEQLRLDSPSGSVTFNLPAPGLRLALGTLASSRATEDELAEQVLVSDGVATLAQFYYCLEQLRGLVLLSYSVPAGAGPMLTFEPTSPAFRPEGAGVETDRSFVLSRFAYGRRVQSALVLDSPIAHARAIVHGTNGAALLRELARPRSSVELAAATDRFNEETASQLLGLLASAALVSEARADGSTAEDEDETLAQWEFHDLLFHARSRSGRHDFPSGATYRFRGRIPPSPAVKPHMSEDVTVLFRPDLHRLMVGGVPLTRAIEQRLSIREHGERPITVGEVGEFLYRTVRVRSVRDPHPTGGRPYSISSRPYPGSGSAYELEVYLTVEACDGIPPGLHHYEPAEHQLSRISGPTARTQALLRSAAAAAGIGRLPQVLITLAARFQRVSWKYESIAYALVLQDVGALYQTMYLVATAMGLAPCALGSGNSDVFAQATGLRYLEESSVGEFILGSRRR
ncbi:MAG TPA: SagB family peptide dehydrogenase [Dehalococcoidia bacterium]|nr:SagB family peptide dehydrogenase [Dehalococcoidia bacterium]